MDDELAAGMAQAATEMGQQPTLQSTLDAICSHAVTDLRADACGIFLLKGRRITVAALSEPRVAEAERIQLETGEGPCLETVWTAESILVSDLRRHTRWPRWAARMVEIGWLTALSVRLVDDGRTVGSLNLFCRDTDAFSQDDVAVALLFARHASLALAASRTEASLTEAADARHRIGVAQGILMVRYGLSLEDAFLALRRQSQQANSKLHQVAGYVIEHRELPQHEGVAAVPA